jgi:hypothetical protein
MSVVLYGCIFRIMFQKPSSDNPSLFPPQISQLELRLSEVKETAARQATEVLRAQQTAAETQVLLSQSNAKVQELEDEHVRNTRQVRSTPFKATSELLYPVHFIPCFDGGPEGDQIEIVVRVL